LFKRAEHHVKGADDFHGVDGPLTVSPVEHDILSDAFIEAARRHGVPPILDFNRGDNEGASYFEMSTQRGRRVSAAKAYLRRSIFRSNLRIITDAHVNRVLFDGRRAVAVEYVQAGSLVRVRARREIVISAGTLASPLILQRSGIGDPKLLKAQDIDVVENRPAVGENFQDHLQVRLVLRSRKPVTLNDVYHRRLHGLAALTRYLVGRRGPLATGIHPAGAFLRSSPDVARPDLQIHFALVSFDRLGAPPHSYSGFTMSACQLRPESRGRVRIGGKDPFAAPQMEARYLSAEVDRAILLKGLAHLRALAKLDPLAQLVVDETKPGPDCRREDDCLSYIRQTALSVHHQVGTCRMGSDEAAVVDPRLRVRGVERLRVADGSIMPRIVSGNTNAPIIMIGEKASDLIREDLRL
jgi:choline dehydrogenase